MSDIAEFKTHKGLDAADMWWLLGVTPCRWGKIMRDARERPQMPCHPGHALLIRWMVAHPGHTPQLIAPSPAEYLDRLQAVSDSRITVQWLGLALGAHGSAGHRWVSLGDEVNPVRRRALGLLDTADPGLLQIRWDEWCANARLEARLRGLGDLDSRLSWTKKSVLKNAA